jgi:hypothetical protein
VELYELQQLACPNKNTLTEKEKVFWEYVNGNITKNEAIRRFGIEADFQDSNWRNELRNYKNSLLKAYLNSTVSSKDLKRNYLLNNQKNEYWNKEYSLWRKHYAVDEELLDAYFDVNQMSKVQKDKDLLAFVSELEHEFLNIKQKQDIWRAEWERRLAYLNRLIRIRDLERDKSRLPNHSKYKHYLELRREAFYSKGREEIMHLENALVLLDETDHPNLSKEKERRSLLNNLGVQYFLMEEYEKALNYYEELLQQTNMPAIRLNYITCLLKLEKFETALDLLEGGFFDDLNEHQIDIKARTIKPMLYLFLKDLKSAKLNLPHQVSFGINTDYLYARMVYMSYYLAKNDLEMLERECLNFKRVARKSKKFHAHYNYAVLMEKAIVKPSGVREIKEHWVTFEEMNNELVNYLPSIYLKKEIEKRVR